MSEDMGSAESISFPPSTLILHRQAKQQITIICSHCVHREQITFVRRRCNPGYQYSLISTTVICYINQRFETGQRRSTGVKFAAFDVVKELQWHDVRYIGQPPQSPNFSIQRYHTSQRSDES
jgi:hypothetical protein